MQPISYNAAASNPASVMGDESELALTIDPVSPEVSLHQLRSVVAELFTALYESLSDHRGNAEECLRRAATLLEVAELDASPARIGVRQGLAPWQVRRVISYVEANLDTRIKNSDLAAVAR